MDLVAVSLRALMVSKTHPRGQEARRALTAAVTPMVVGEVVDSIHLNYLNLVTRIVKFHLDQKSNAYSSISNHREYIMGSLIKMLPAEIVHETFLISGSFQVASAITMYREQNFYASFK